MVGLDPFASTEDAEESLLTPLELKCRFIEQLAGYFGSFESGAISRRERGLSLHRLMEGRGELRILLAGVLLENASVFGHSCLR